MNSGEWRSDLVRRLGRLEARHRRYRAVSFVGWIVAAATILMGQSGSGSRELDVSVLRLRDASGRVAGLLETAATGPRLQLFDRDNRVRLALSLIDDNPFVVLKSADGRVTSGLSVDPTGKAGLVIDGGQERAKVVLAVDQGDATLELFRPGFVRGLLVGANPVTAGLNVFDPHGVARLQLSASAQGSEVALVDAQGKTSAELGAQESGPGLVLLTKEEKSGVELSLLPDGTQLRFYDGMGQLRAALGVTQKNASALVIAGANEQPQAEIGGTASGGRVVVYDKEGKRRWAAEAGKDGPGS